MYITSTMWFINWFLILFLQLTRMREIWDAMSYTYLVQDSIHLVGAE